MFNIYRLREIEEERMTGLETISISYLFFFLLFSLHFRERFVSGPPPPPTRADPPENS